MSGLPSKGKLKDFNHDFDDLDPEITYRHITSPTIGPKHPLRVVALCDCNAFYANCEQVRLGIDPETPLVVIQWGALIAVNYPARNYGISRMDKLEDARKRCPDLVVVHVATYAEGDDKPEYWEKPNIKTHKISLDYYRRESVKVHTMFKELLPTGEVEKASIDEAFIDFSIPVRDILLERYPYLAEVPSDGLDTPLPPPPRVSFAGLGNLIPIDATELDPEQEVTTELVEEIEGDRQMTWHDVSLAIATEIMTRMRKEVYEKLGYRTSAGLARNKFLAKLSASYRKFNADNILRNSAIPGFLIPMPFQKIRFLGGKLGKALADEFDVSTVGDLLSISIDEMQNKFGECSIWVYEILRGIDRSEVKEKTVINKSMNAAKNLPKPITKPEDGPHWIRMLAAELTIRLNEAREKTPGLWPRTLALHVREGWGWDSARCKQQPFPVHKNLTTEMMVNEALKLWKEIVGKETLWEGKKAKEMKITHINLGLTGITWTEQGQRGIEGFFQTKAPNSINRAKSEAPASQRANENVDNVRRKRSASLASTTNDDDMGELTLGKKDPVSSDQFSFVCDRCHRTISLSPHVLSQINDPSTNDDDAIDTDELRERALRNLSAEHDDYHFARDLARSEGPINSGPMLGKGEAKRKASPTRPMKRKKHKSEGIAKFFIKKEKVDT